MNRHTYLFKHIGGYSGIWLTRLTSRKGIRWPRAGRRFWKILFINNFGILYRVHVLPIEKDNLTTHAKTGGSTISFQKIVFRGQSRPLNNCSWFWLNWQMRALGLTKESNCCLRWHDSCWPFGHYGERACSPLFCSVSSLPPETKHWPMWAWTLFFLLFWWGFLETMSYCCRI